MPATSETLSRLLGSLYEAAAEPTQWALFLEQLARSTRASSAALVMHDFDHALCIVSSSWGLDPEADRLYQEHYHELDVWAQAANTKPRGYVCNSESICPLPELKKEEIYNDFFAHFGIVHGMFALLENDEARFAGVSLYRDKPRAQFTSSDLDILRFLTPHLQRVFRLRLHFSELRSLSAGLETALDMLPTGVILFGAKGEIVLMNSSALAFVAEKDGLLVTRGRLGAERPAESSLLEKRIVQAASASSGGSLRPGGIVMISRRSRTPFQIQLSPIPNSGVLAPKPITAVAFVSDPSQQKRPPRELLQALYSLTPAECRVALLLGDGHAPRQIANMVGVTDNTVRSQIKSIFSKTGVKRQGELIRLLMSNSEFAVQARLTA
jgi:DNA-binding CsgD family transcriptional regulator